jgi:DNA-binding CsgD family transcriptional regulator
MSTPVLIDVSPRGGVDDSSPKTLHCKVGEAVAAVAGLPGDLVQDAPATGEFDLYVSVVEGALRLDVVPCDGVRDESGPSLPLSLTVTPLTPAEERVLRYLPTSRSFASIADELCVSRNTVKTHAIAIYRKFGVVSRHAAVDVARDLVLLGLYVLTVTVP